MCTLFVPKYGHFRSYPVTRPIRTFLTLAADSEIERSFFESRVMNAIRVGLKKNKALSEKLLADCDNHFIWADTFRERICPIVIGPVYERLF